MHLPRQSLRLNRRCVLCGNLNNFLCPCCNRQFLCLNAGCFAAYHCGEHQVSNQCCWNYNVWSLWIFLFIHCERIRILHYPSFWIVFLNSFFMDCSKMFLVSYTNTWILPVWNLSKNLASLLYFKILFIYP